MNGVLQCVAIQQAVALLEDVLVDLHLASAAASDPISQGILQVRLVSEACADADKRAEQVSGLAR